MENMAATFIMVFLLFNSFEEIVGPVSSKWNFCNCRWLEWSPWSSCNKQCYGRHYRDRKVRHTNKHGCTEFTDCASNGMGYEWADCNKFCYNGGTFRSSYSGCSCIPGKYGRCCDKTVMCDAPIKPGNSEVTTTGVIYGSKATYTCHTDYNMTEGTNPRTCQVNAGWSGATPTCRYVNTCSSSPCLNGGTCVNGIEMYTCQCKPGWSGPTCENDFQPPVMTDCSDGKLVHTVDTKVTVNWSVPNFTDPFGKAIVITKNYQTSSTEAPWGDFAVQYVATKPSNGMKTECNFKVEVRPFPCPSLNIPNNGARVCNGWKKDYAQACLVFCSDGFSLDIGKDPRQWYICGASGHWLPSGHMPNCSMPMVNIGSGPLDVKDYHYRHCTDKTIKETYISRLNTSLANSLCDKNPVECNANNVVVDC